MIVIFAVVSLAGLSALIFAALAPLLISQQNARDIYVVSLSSGVSSAVAAERALQQYGADNVLLVFMDTKWEDEDNYRFLDACGNRWQAGIARITEGRKPLEVAEDQHIIPNSLVAPCTRVLKIAPFLRYVIRWQEAGHHVTILLGMNWTEQHRMDAPRRNYGERGFAVDYPLMWRPYVVDMFALVRSWGIEPPRMYRMGYTHANCGGRCVKQGHNDWRRTLTHFPDRFEEVATWEDRQRQNDINSDYAILKDRRNGEMRSLTLYTLKAQVIFRHGDQLSLWTEPTGDDTSSCFCNAGDPGPVDKAAR